MCVLGGISTDGGKGNFPGVIIAIFIIGLLRYGLGLINVNSQTIRIIIGALLILVVMRNARKALLSACLCPADAIRRAEYAGDYTARLALQEERKTLPVGAVWDYYCAERGIPVGADWLEKARGYEKDVTSKR